MRMRHNTSTINGRWIAIVLACFLAWWLAIKAAFAIASWWLML